MMEVEHTKTNFYPQLPDTVWKNAPRVAWQTLSEHVEDFMNIIIRTQHLRQRAWNLQPDGDTRWVAYFNELLERYKVEQEFKTVAEGLEKYSELKSVGVKPSEAQIKIDNATQKMEGAN